MEVTHRWRSQRNILFCEKYVVLKYETWWTDCWLWDTSVNVSLIIRHNDLNEILTIYETGLGQICSHYNLLFNDSMLISKTTVSLQCFSCSYQKSSRVDFNPGWLKKIWDINRWLMSLLGPKKGLILGQLQTVYCIGPNLYQEVSTLFRQMSCMFSSDIITLLNFGVDVLPDQLHGNWLEK